MTNTNDFRKYSYQSDPSALISSFNYTRATAAPRIRPEVEPQRNNLRVREEKGLKSREQLRREEKASFRKVLRIAVVAVFCLGLIALVINSFALKNQLTREIARTETAVANANSEYISLESQLNSLVSISMIDKYAVEKLGMTKVRSSQIQYMDVNEFKENREAELKKEKAQQQKAKEKQAKESKRKNAQSSKKSGNN